MRTWLTDIVFSIILVLIILFCIYRFYTGIVLDQEPNGKPVATISIKKFYVTRRSGKFINWQFVKNNSPVYADDYIRTSSASAASIIFPDQGALGLGESSMLQIVVPEKKSEVNLQFIQGEITLASGSGTTKYAISTSDGKSLQLGEGTKANFARDGDKISILVVKGEAKIVSKDKVEVIPENTQVNMDTKSDTITRTQFNLHLTTPIDDASLLDYTQDKIAPVQLKWERLDSKKASNYTIEVARDKFFNQIVQQLKATTETTTVTLATGTWYWRVSDTLGEKSAVQKFNLIVTNYPQAISPKIDAASEYTGASATVDFSWSPVDGVESYQFEIAHEPSFASDKVGYVSTKVGANQFRFTGLTEGNWYWRVLPNYNAQIIAAIPQSPNRISLTRTEVQPPIVLRLPLNKAAITQSADKPSPITFAWSAIDTAKKYQLVIAEDATLSKVIEQKDTTLTYLTMDQAAESKLSIGKTYYWSVRWQDAQQKYSPYVDAHEFLVNIETVPAKITQVTAEVSPLPLAPKNNFIFDFTSYQEQKLKPKIDFIWLPLEGATDYKITINNGETDVFTSPYIATTSYTFTDFRKLRIGKFSWTLQAFTRDSSGKEIGRSKTVSEPFEITAQRISNVEVNDEKIYVH